MRILYFYPSHQFNSGSPKALVAMIDALDRAHYEPLFWATGDGPLIAEMTGRGVTLLRGPAGSVNRRHPAAAFRAVTSKVRALRCAHIDLLHVNEYSWNLDLVLAAGLLRIPVILHAHNPVTMERWNLDRMVADRILFVSDAHRRETGHLERIGGKARVLHNPLDIDHYAGGRRIRGALGLREDDIMVLSIGHVVPAKGMDLLLEVARRLLPRHPRLHFVIAGPAKKGQEAFEQAMRRRAEQPELAGRVHFLGARGDVPDLLRSADLFVFPSRGETFGLVVGEAMAASVPVVTTDIGGIPEVVGTPDSAVMLPVGDVEGFTREVERLVSDPAARHALGQRGRQSVEQQFGRTAFARALEAIYRELLC